MTAHPRKTTSLTVIGRLLFSGLALPLLVVACSDGAKEETITLQDEGIACVQDADYQGCDEAFQFRSGERLQIEVNFNTCLSSSCNRRGDTSCQITRSGNVLAVTATGSYVNILDAVACTADCGSLTATCESEILPDGDYELRYDGHVLPITIPSTKHQTCTGSSGIRSQCCDDDSDCPGASCNTTFHSCNGVPIPGETNDASAQ